MMSLSEADGDDYTTSSTSQPPIVMKQKQFIDAMTAIVTNSTQAMARISKENCPFRHFSHHPSYPNSSYHEGEEESSIF